MGNNTIKRGKVLQCTTCGWDKYVLPSRIAMFKFCSPKCKRLSQETRKKISLNNTKNGLPKCVDCDKKLTNYRYNTRCRKCFLKISFGNNAPNWRGGLTKLCGSIRKLKQYKIWRKNVFVRDKYTCQNCGQTGGRIEANHLTPFSILLRTNSIETISGAINCQDLWDINNGETLCKTCHKLTDSYGTGVLDYGIKTERWLTEKGINIQSEQFRIDIQNLIEILFYNKFQKIFTKKDILKVIYQNNVKTFFHVIDGRVVAMLTLYTVNLFSRDLGVIEEVSTLKEYQGRGIASKLIDIAIKYAKKMGLTCIELTCKPGLASFYKNKNFYDRHNKAMRLWINKQ